MTTFVLTVSGILVAFLGSILGNFWLSLGASVVAFLSATVQFRDSLPFVFRFTESSWLGDGRDFRLEIPASRHKKENAAATVYRVDPEKGYAAAFCEVRLDAKGALFVCAVTKFAGKVVVK